MPPYWVKSEPTRNGAIHRTAIFSIPDEDKADCISDLYKQAQLKTNEYIDEITGVPGTGA